MKETSRVRLSALGQLPVFVAVAEQRSFSRAAEALGISPSAASQAIARLERDLAATLFVRTTRSVSLTDAGARLLESAGPAVSHASAALDAVASINRFGSKSATVSSTAVRRFAVQMSISHPSPSLSSLAFSAAALRSRVFT